MSRPFIIGIAGGTGSGKTRLAETLIKRYEQNRIGLIPLDAYYKDLNHVNYEERCFQNFDHPDAFDESLIISHMHDLIKAKSIEQPIYDFSQHLRKKETIHLGDHNIILLEGILVLHFESIRSLLDMKVYVDADPDIRLIRRLRRDLTERGRSLESVLQQYEESVRPMHLKFVEPTKKYADIIVPHGGKNDVVIDLLQARIAAEIQTESQSEKK